MRWRTAGKLDFDIAAAMVLAVLVLGAHYALFVASQDYGTHFWAQPSLGAIAPFYERFLLPPLILGGLAFFVVALLAGASAQQRAHTQMTTFRLHEWTAIVALASLPPVVIVVSMVTTHAFLSGTFSGR